MEKALHQTRRATASLGKFQESLKNETNIKPVKGKKRKLPGNNTTKESLTQERNDAMKVLKKMKKGDLDVEAAVNKQIRMENIQ